MKVCEYDYDPSGRKINSWETINSGTPTLLSQNQYDELGNLYKKKLHSTDGGTNFLQTITYTYNERGWLTKAQADKLDLNLRYNQSAHGAAPQYNGNIAELEYTGTNSGNRYFKYNYDIYNRLTKAAYSSNSNNLSEKLSYDKNGNITALVRGDTTGTATTYTYANSNLSNQLTSTSGPVSGNYSYDGNGNAISDSRRGISTITYNQLNLPKTVTGNGNASYTYDASGTKLSSTQAGTTREYISGIQYTNGTIDFVQTEEGIATRDQSTGTYKYQYNLKDHLGDTRVTIDENGGTARVIQEDEYYAFGLDKPNYRYGTENKYLYNGKEKQDVLADEYDYGARFYDPVIGRWNVIDPKSEISRRWSPYNYGVDNPIRFIDPDGMSVTVGPNGGTLLTGADMNSAYQQYARNCCKTKPGQSGRSSIPEPKTPKITPQPKIPTPLGNLKPRDQGTIDMPDDEEVNYQDMGRRTTSLATVKGVVDGYGLASGWAALKALKATLLAIGKDAAEIEYTFTKTAGSHLADIVKKGENAGQLSRPYMKSPLTIQEIISTGEGVPDASFSGGMNWKVPGTFRGSEGIWELGLNPDTKVIYHFNFVH